MEIIIVFILGNLVGFFMGICLGIAGDSDGKDL